MKTITWNGLEFYTEKSGTKNWCLKENITKSYVSKEDPTEKKSIESGLSILEKQGIKKTKEAIEHKLKQKLNNETILSLAPKFEAIFKANLSLFFIPIVKMISNRLMFDIIKFDNHIKTPSGVSCKDWVKQQYGQEALELIQQLNSL